MSKPLATTLLVALLAPGFAACVYAPALPTRADLANRMRIRIEGREIPSITTADYFIYCVVEGPDGTRRGIDVLAPESSSSEGLSLQIGMDIRSAFELPDIELGETIGGEPNFSEDIMLPPGFMLCFEPGTFYAYRIIDHSRTMAADLAPEIRLGQLRKDGLAYYEVQASDGPNLERAKSPPNWPPVNSRPGNSWPGK